MRVFKKDELAFSFENHYWLHTYIGKQVFFFLKQSKQVICQEKCYREICEEYSINYLRASPGEAVKLCLGDLLVMGSNQETASLHMQG